MYLNVKCRVNIRVNGVVWSIVCLFVLFVLGIILLKKYVGYVMGKLKKGLFI